MVKQENINEKLIRTYSDEDKFVKQVESNVIYKEAIDVVPVRFTYIEVDSDKEEISEENNS